jgi:phage baseplate assembly protein W
MIEVILRTAPGEQLMRPEFGGGLERMLHEPNTLATRARMQEQIADGLTRWEPRILLDRIDVDSALDAREVRITVAYRLARTSEAASVTAVMPLGAG